MAKKTFVIVSGFPRSGTSMTMLMLIKGGVNAIYESTLKDEHNPNGYFETRFVGKLERKSEWMDEAPENSAFKCFAGRLPFLPARFDYKVIFIERDWDEAIKSLLYKARREFLNDTEKRKALYAQRMKAVDELKKKNNFEFLFINYKDVIESPEKECKQIKKFLGIDLNIPEMSKVPDKNLYRTKII